MPELISIISILCSYKWNKALGITPQSKFMLSTN